MVEDSPKHATSGSAVHAGTDATSPSVSAAPAPRARNLPWMQVYAADWLTRTQLLSPLARSAMFDLSCMTWIHGPLPDDAAVLARAARVSFDEWSSVSPELLRAGWAIEDGRWIDPQLERRRVEAQEWYDQKIRASDAAVRKRRAIARGPVADRADDRPEVLAERQTTGRTSDRSINRAEAESESESESESQSESPSTSPAAQQQQRSAAQNLPTPIELAQSARGAQSPEEVFQVLSGYFFMLFGKNSQSSAGDRKKFIDKWPQWISGGLTPNEILSAVAGRLYAARENPLPPVTVGYAFAAADDWNAGRIELLKRFKADRNSGG